MYECEVCGCMSVRCVCVCGMCVQLCDGCATVTCVYCNVLHVWIAY